jgi:hypothetical protein
MADQYRCDRCQQEFQSQDQLNRHNQQQHQMQQGGQQGMSGGERGMPRD